MSAVMLRKTGTREVAGQSTAPLAQGQRRPDERGDIMSAEVLREEEAAGEVARDSRYDIQLTIKSTKRKYVT
jgi:hypothetical protein